MTLFTSYVHLALSAPYILTSVPTFCLAIILHYTFASHGRCREYELDGCNRSHRTSDFTGVVFTCSCGTFAYRVHDSGHLASERVTWVLFFFEIPFNLSNIICNQSFLKNTPSSACRVWLQGYLSGAHPSSISWISSTMSLRKTSTLTIWRQSFETKHGVNFRKSSAWSHVPPSLSCFNSSSFHRQMANSVS